jgi:membrane protein DedA with SNARE-associated domain
VTHLLLSYGLVLLFLIVAGESAGIPLPGETALIAASILATPEQGHYSLPAVIAVAAAGAIVGDNVGYWIGRTGGRRLVERWSLTRRYAERVLPRGERYFARHGGKTVFVARFVAVLRVTAAWLAGITHMPWWRFLLWNAAGGIVWATGVGLLAYYFGRAAADAVAHFGLLGAVGVIALAALGFVVLHVWNKRVAD